MKRLFGFSVRLQDPFRAREKNIISSVLENLLEKVLEDPKYTHFDMFIILCFADPHKI
jgi:hypothetical protein